MTRLHQPLCLALGLAASLTLARSSSAAAQPMISATPDTLTFDTLVLGQSQTKLVAITNTGNSLLTIHSITENSQDFLVGGFAPVLNPGQTFQLQVTFAPVNVSSPSIPLAISSDASNGPITFVFLEGTALPPGPLIAVSETTIDFGTTVVGTVTPHIFTITNTGTVGLTITRMQSDEPAFSFGPWQTIIPAGASQDVTVFFSPGAAQEYSGTVTIESTAANAPVLFMALSGGAVSYDVVLSPPAVTVNLREGESAERVVRITNNGSVVFPFTNLVYDLSSPTASLPPRRAASATSLPAFFDNFEDGTALEWVFVPGGSPVRGVLAGPGANQSAFLYLESQSVAGHYNGIYTTLPAVRPLEMGFWVRPSREDLFSSYVTVRDAAFREVIFFFAQGNGTLYCNASTGGDANQPYNVFQWYHVEYRNIDWSAKTFDYYLDGALVTAGVLFRNSTDVEDFSRIDLYSFSAGATAQWDDIFVSWGDAPPWLSVAPINGTVTVAGTIGLTLNVDATGLAEGAHEAVLAMRTNAPDTPLIPVPVTLTVDSTGTAASSPPAPIALYQNTPNPFGHGTTIRYSLQQPARAALRVYDVSGALVRTLEDRPHSAGDHRRSWDGRNERGRRVASGVYFYRLTTGDGFAQTRKLLMLR